MIGLSFKYFFYLFIYKIKYIKYNIIVGFKSIFTKRVGLRPFTIC